MGKPAYYYDPGIATINPLDMHKELKRHNLERTNGGIVVANTSLEIEMPTGGVLDITNWLPQAAGHYQISPDINDFVMVPVPTVPADLPNRNGVSFPLAGLMEFLPEEGMLAYKTFKGKPTFYEHRNNDITAAKGVIADTFLRKITGYGGGKQYKLMKLLCFDRTKDPELCRRILAGDINTYSMGAYIDRCTCSYCGLNVGTMQRGECQHINKDRGVPFFKLNGHLVHKVMTGIKGFETSAVESPAWMSAISDRLMTSKGEKDSKFLYTE